MTTLPHAPSTERNREPILSVLRPYFADRRQVLEIGSGTGQHAVHFAAAFPQVQWQATEQTEAQLSDIRAWLSHAALPNTPSPRVLDVAAAESWPADRYDVVFTANTLHFMPWASVQGLFAALPKHLLPGAIVAVYGPFNYGGRFTSDSNAQFEQWLKSTAPYRGIRDFEAVDALAAEAGLTLLQDHEMPANNRCLVWRFHSSEHV